MPSGPEPLNIGDIVPIPHIPDTIYTWHCTNPTYSRHYIQTTMYQSHIFQTLYTHDTVPIPHIPDTIYTWHCTNPTCFRHYIRTTLYQAHMFQTLYTHDTVPVPHSPWPVPCRPWQNLPWRWLAACWAVPAASSGSRRPVSGWPGLYPGYLWFWTRPLLPHLYTQWWCFRCLFTYKHMCMHACMDIFMNTLLLQKMRNSGSLQDSLTNHRTQIKTMTAFRKPV